MREDPGTLSDDDARGLKVSDVIDAYRAHRLDAGDEPLSDAAHNLLYYVVKDLLEDHSGVLALPIEFAKDQLWTLLVMDDGVRLLRLDEDAPEVLVEFLGELRCDFYSEVVSVTDGALMAHLHFADSRLPESIELDLPLQHPPGRDVRLDDAVLAREESIKRLRALLREWAAVRPFRA